MSVDFIERHAASDQPFFLMCHHKAPHRNWQYHPRYRDLFEPGSIPLPETFNDDYSNRAKAAEAAKMRVRSDLLYEDLGLVQPEGGGDVAGQQMVEPWPMRKIPELKPGERITVICAESGENHTFNDPQAFAEFKYQRYMSRYLRTVQAIDDNVGRMLDKLDELGLTENTLVIYTSDQGFFLGEHGWFDKRFMYEESYKMPFLVRYPAAIPAGQHLAGHRLQRRLRADLPRLRRPAHAQLHAGPLDAPGPGRTYARRTGSRWPITATGCTTTSSTRRGRTTACATSATS